MPKTATKKPATATSSGQFIDIGEGCTRYVGGTFIDTDGSHFTYEYTPTLNMGDSKPHADCLKLIRDCKLLGGGWDMALDTHELTPRISHDASYPATYPELAADTESSLYWTQKPWMRSDGTSSSVYVWVVHFNDGDVYYDRRVSGGFARGVRRVRVASPGQ